VSDPRRPSSTSPGKGEVGAQRRVGVGSAERFNRTLVKTARARKLRREMTEAEARLWSRLRGGHFMGLSFRRQHPIGSYILDFYCPQIRLAIEVDGGQHGSPASQRTDGRRTNRLAESGISQLRFWNHEVLANIDGVLDEIERAVGRIRTTTPTRSAVPTDLPLSGGGGGGSLDIVFGEVDR
jgi:very-short-patch-repair endonuclease